MDGRCIICSISLDRGSGGEDFFLEEEWWKRHVLDFPGWLWIDARELENRFLTRGKHFWSNLYRLIIYDPIIQRHRVTGVGHHPGIIGDRLLPRWYYAAARDINQAVIGIPEETDPELITVVNSRLSWWWAGEEPKRDWHTLALAMHMHCWTMARRIIGPKVESEYLRPATALVLRKAREREVAARRAREMGCQDQEEWQRSSTTYEEPLKIMSMKKLIEAHHTRSANSTLPSSTQSMLPYEIRCIILDYLDHQTLHSLLRAVNCPLDDSYWRSRMSFYLIGMEEVVKEAEQQHQLNWQALCLETEQLDATTDVFRIRHRVVDSLTDIKAQLDRGISVSLPNVLNHIQDEMVGEYWEGYAGHILCGLSGTKPAMMQCLVNAGFLTEAQSILYQQYASNPSPKNFDLFSET
ncbi:hypothetical protein ASPZODRAFT_147333 [Penicilliopsis zonata CBS 506.65]|uniref:F-box domain-containing protein n=1 Tax=Penicilliopsis zonata CBS 506.65 TaxID=1073090 RepID=A0A1L9S5Q9_9EURO|nr:hypothetical protein ASPZODRAFT_147333 [Penicilliopsis zonata CBS 506.65]OJJ42501.1 hypothetical protein ASPZODRAFT_147333 [Penicilliopsis zonata CBS 506.65]